MSNDTVPLPDIASVAWIHPTRFTKHDGTQAMRASVVDDSGIPLVRRSDHEAALLAYGDARAAQAVTQRIQELAAALGWPGGISKPTLDWAQMLREVARLRAATTAVS